MMELLPSDTFWDEVTDSIEPDTFYFWTNLDTCVPFVHGLTVVNFLQ